jgi:hypothetical protein
MQYSQASRCGTPSLLTVFDSDPGHRKQQQAGTPGLTNNPGQHRQSNLKSVSTDYLLLQFFYPTIQCNCSACSVPPDAGLQKNATFPH